MYIIRPIDNSKAIELATNGKSVYIVIMSSLDEFTYLDLSSENLQLLQKEIDENKNKEWLVFASEFGEIPLEDYIDLDEGDIIFTSSEPCKALNASELIKTIEHLKELEV